MGNAIIIKRGSSCWNARYVGPHAAEIRKLFGTDTLPTPYRLEMPVDEVVSLVQQRNLDVEVV